MTDKIVFGDVNPRTLEPYEIKPQTINKIIDDQSIETRFRLKRKYDAYCNTRLLPTENENQRRRASFYLKSITKSGKVGKLLKKEKSFTGSELKLMEEYFNEIEFDPFF